MWKVQTQARSQSLITVSVSTGSLRAVKSLDGKVLVARGTRLVQTWGFHANRSQERKVMQNLASPFRTPGLGFGGGTVNQEKQIRGHSLPCHKFYI